MSQMGQKPKYPRRADASAFHPTSDIRRDRRQTDPASSTTAFTVTGFGTGRDDSAMVPHALARDGRGSGQARQRSHLARSAAQGMERPYWITVAKPACVIRVVTGLVDPSVAAASAPDDVVTRLSMMACGKMHCVWPIGSPSAAPTP
jgi:hypothetical protein